MTDDVDLSQTVTPKSDQLNADDFIGNPYRTIKITSVRQRAGDQPIVINFEGDQGKPWLPCKSMRRVLIEAWGVKGATYVGRSITLYRDPKVRFGGAEVGGIRISHMSHIDRPMVIALTATKGKRAPFEVHPLATTDKPTTPTKKEPTQAEKVAKANKVADDILDEVNAAKTEDGVRAVLTKHADMLARVGKVDVSIPARVQMGATVKIGSLEVPFGDARDDQPKK